MCLPLTLNQRVVGSSPTGGTRKQRTYDNRPLLSFASDYREMGGFSADEIHHDNSAVWLLAVTHDLAAKFLDHFDNIRFAGPERIMNASSLMDQRMDLLVGNGDGERY